MQLKSYKKIKKNPITTATSHGLIKLETQFHRIIVKNFINYSEVIKYD